MPPRKKKELDNEPEGSCRHMLSYDDCPFGCADFYDENGCFDLSSDDPEEEEE